ncbi:unannotated protein [freshwater metagenome]|uniref:Unannotated protein n=1 Tax=freshwater metagenome TaxID=449393 RepID=A0A6J7DAZ1_9ZZZZ
MAMRIGSGVSAGADSRVAAIEAATDARQRLDGAPVDLAMVFSSGSHLADPQATLDGVLEALDPAALIGCASAAVLSCGQDYEGRSAVTVWAASAPDADLETFHLRTSETADGSLRLVGLPDPARIGATVLLPQPGPFPVQAALDALTATAPGRPVLGGIASGLSPEGLPILFHADQVLSDGAVGVTLDGVDVLPCVSQGVAAVGPPLEVTGVENGIILTIDGRPALESLRRVIDGLTGYERATRGGGLLLGVSHASEPGHDYLVQGPLQVDHRVGSVAITTAVREGAFVQLHRRDARAAASDLREQLALRSEALGGSPAGALLFTCNGRGSRFFGSPHSDAAAIEETLGGIATAGFFAAGEIGPIAGANLVHEFTATAAVFAS